MRPAASAWEEEYAGKLALHGYQRGAAAPTIFFHPEKGVGLVVWGNDFTFLGRDRDLKEAADMMKEYYEIKVRAVLGPEAKDDKEVRILNRKVVGEDAADVRARREAREDGPRGVEVERRVQGVGCGAPQGARRGGGRRRVG